MKRLLLQVSGFWRYAAARLARRTFRAARRLQARLCAHDTTGTGFYLANQPAERHGGLMADSR